jgi:hypothetical protein
MTKKKESKLDGYAERLDEWFLAGKTLAEAQEQLRLDGCAVSLSRLSSWWQSRQEERLQERLLANIASGARQVKEIEGQFEKSPPPEVETIIKLQRVLIMQLSTQAQANPELIALVAKLTKPSLEYAKLIEKRADRDFAIEKFQFDAAKACLENLSELRAIASGDLSKNEKVQEVRLKLFGVLPGKGS